MGDLTVFLAPYSVKLANYDYDKLGEVYNILGEFATYWERFATYWEITTYREGCDILGLYNSYPLKGRRHEPVVLSSTCTERLVAHVEQTYM